MSAETGPGSAELRGHPVICEECYSDRCWRCNHDCDCLHPDNEGVFL